MQQQSISLPETSDLPLKTNDDAQSKATIQQDNQNAQNQSSLNTSEERKDPSISPNGQKGNLTKLHSPEAKQQDLIFRTKRSYVTVELEQRKSLINMIKDGQTIKEAALSLKINYSTAKHIVKQYKKSGSFETTLQQKRKAAIDVHSLEKEVAQVQQQQQQQFQPVAAQHYGQNPQGQSIFQQNIQTMQTQSQQSQSQSQQQQQPALALQVPMHDTRYLQQQQMMLTPMKNPYSTKDTNPMNLPYSQTIPRQNMNMTQSLQQLQTPDHSYEHMLQKARLEQALSNRLLQHRDQSHHHYPAGCSAVEQSAPAHHLNVAAAQPLTTITSSQLLLQALKAQQHSLAQTSSDVCPPPVVGPNQANLNSTDLINHLASVKQDLVYRARIADQFQQELQKQQLCREAANGNIQPAIDTQKNNTQKVCWPSAPSVYQQGNTIREFTRPVISTNSQNSVVLQNAPLAQNHGNNSQGFPLKELKPANQTIDTIQKSETSLKSQIQENRKFKIARPQIIISQKSSNRSTTTTPTLDLLGLANPLKKRVEKATEKLDEKQQILQRMLQNSSTVVVVPKKLQSSSSSQSDKQDQLSMVGSLHRNDNKIMNQIFIPNNQKIVSETKYNQQSLEEPRPQYGITQDMTMSHTASASLGKINNGFSLFKATRKLNLYSQQPCLRLPINYSQKEQADCSKIDQQKKDK